MPLSEFLRMARGRIDSAQPRPSPLGFSSRGEDEFLELVWENGQLMMQGQSSRSPRNPAFPSNLPKFREPATSSRIGKLGEVESMLNDLSPVVPSGEMDLGQDDDMAPWLNYSVDDVLPSYCSDFLPEISGLTGNGMSTQNSFASGNKKSTCDESGASTLKGSSFKPRLLSSWPQQVSDPSLASGVSDIVSNNTSKHIANGSANMKMPSTNSNLLNFSHFSRPVTLAKPNVQTSDALPASVVSISERMESKGKGLTFDGGDPMKSRFIDQLNTAHTRFDSHGPSATLFGSSKALPAERNENLRRESSSKIHCDASKGVHDGEKSIEPMVGSSSVGSGNSGDRISCEQTHNSKRKFQDLEESEFNCDDVDTESVGVQKPTAGRGGAGSKRSRAAEVHNLSERRRRDRINEKMRALQELIPNCNKADKASMLDEAIEYLKTLQLQVQMMSMGAGLCMPPMMFPSGIHPAHMPHYSPMGIGMGFGMGLPEMNVGSSVYPMFPVPQMQGAHFPSQMQGPVNFQRVPGPNLPMYVHPSQGHPTSLPVVPLAPRPPVTSTVAPLAPRPPVTSTIGLGASRVESHGDLPGTSRTLDHDNAVASKSPMHKAEASGSINHSSKQLQATNEVLDKPAAMQENERPTDVPGKASQATDVCKVTGGE